MPSRRLFTAFALLCATALVGARAADAQSAATLEGEQIKTEIYFGSDLGAAQTVSEQAWDEFVAGVIRDRFPSGFTVIDASGKGARAEGPLTRTRVLVVVHPAGADADARLSDIKAEYKKRFPTAGVFHLNETVHVRQ